MSAVRNRIASLEAASTKAGSVPSPSRPVYRQKNTNTPQKKPDVASDQQQESPLTNSFRRGRSPFQRAKNTADTSLHTSNTSEQSDGQGMNKSSSGDQGATGEGSHHGSESSTTLTASENRKSRIRQSHQQVRGKSNTPTTNLSEKRRQRRILQSQRRLKSAHKASDNSQSDGDGMTSGRTMIDNSRVPDSPGDFSTGSNNSGRWSKLSRLQTRRHQSSTVFGSHKRDKSVC